MLETAEHTTINVYDVYFHVEYAKSPLKSNRDHALARLDFGVTETKSRVSQLKK